MFPIPQLCLTVWDNPNCQSGMDRGHAREKAKSLTGQMTVFQCLATSLGTPHLIDAGAGKALIYFLCLTIITLSSSTRTSFLCSASSPSLQPVP